MACGIDPRLLLRFAEVLEYPGPDVIGAARECQALAPDSAEGARAAAMLRDFLHYALETPPGRMEEIYTGTFDLAASCYPYVGYHLLGESYKRSVFMLRLKEIYEAHDFDVPGELPDHLSVMLRFLASCKDGDLVAELVCDALLPALERMVAEDQQEEDGSSDQPARGGEAGVYRQVLSALRLVLRENLDCERGVPGGAFR
ncbi:MAG: molecular chaperone TorD family protein [Chloroflexi bacterium]|nr:molecular chaperone TorD family protein [Chloroflexota bacterium]